MATFVAIAAHVSRALHALRVPHAFQVFVDWHGREDADSVRAQFTALGISAPFTVASASDAQTTRALQALASAHVLVMGPSSLSYAAGLLHEPGVGIVITTPQFHSAREDWHELPRFDEDGRGASGVWLLRELRNHANAASATRTSCAAQVSIVGCTPSAWSDGMGSG